jgi:hypothetical protein
MGVHASGAVQLLNLWRLLCYTKREFDKARRSELSTFIRTDWHIKERTSYLEDLVIAARLASE